MRSRVEETPLFTAAGASLGTYVPVIRIVDSQYVTLRGFSVCCSSGRGITISESDWVTVADSTVTEVGNRAIGGHGDNIVISGNVVGLDVVGYTWVLQRTRLESIATTNRRHQRGSLDLTEMKA